MRRHGVVILSVFAVIWAAAGASGLANAAARLTVLVVGLALSAAMIGLAFRPDAPPVSKRPRRPPTGWRRHLGLVNIAQGLAIALVVVALVALDRPALIPAAVCLIVGIHFLPLARLFDVPLYRSTGVALCLVAALGFTSAAAWDGEVSRAVVGIGAAASLWATCACMVGWGATKAPCPERP